MGATAGLWSSAIVSSHDARLGDVHSRTEARSLAFLAHLALIGVAYAIVLAVDAMNKTIRLVLMLGTPLVVGLLISRLLGLVRSGIERSARQARALRDSERRKLFALTSRLRERRQRVHIVTPGGSTVLRTLQLVEFSRAAPMHDSLEAALALEAGAPGPA